MNPRMTKLDKRIRKKIHKIAEEYYNLQNMTTAFMDNEFSIKIKIEKVRK